jgi:hypothetical protein
MPHYKYLIVGGGMTADAAARAFRKRDPNGSIGLISAESDPLANAFWLKGFGLAVSAGDRQK